jgi:phenylacetate-CoA ligase
MTYTPLIELQAPNEIKSFQEAKVLELLSYVSSRSPYYQNLLRDNDIDINAIKTLDDFTGIPTTSKDEFHRYNWDFLCVPHSQIVEYTSTSGTLGSPVTVALTEKDLERLAYNECISFTCADGNPDDLYQLMLTLDRQFMAGMAYYEGIRKLGAGLIRVGPGLPQMQWEIINRLKPSALVAVPSFIIKLIEYAQENGMDIKNSSVQKAICIGEGLRAQDLSLNSLGKRIADEWGIKLYGTYASTEMQTAFTECAFGRGGHHHPELIHVELLDEEGRPVKLGDPGEITVSTIGVEAMPLVRYKTGDMAIGYQDHCSCGRNTLRIGPVLGRKQQMIKLKGTTMYPPGIFEVLNRSKNVVDYVVEVVTGELGTDELKLHVLVAQESHSALDELKTDFQSRLKVIPTILLSDRSKLDTLQMAGQGRKLRKFIDGRK